MRCLVTGADGFIGSHLCEALRDRGDEVTGLALYNSFDTHGWLDEVDGVRKVRGDVRDAEQMRRMVKGHDIVFHLAALISVPDSYERPRSYYDTNVGGTLNMLEACREHGVKMVHTSTSEVYGSAQYTPMDEKHPINPQSPYAASKVAADALVNSYRLSYGMELVTLRPFNAFGPRQSERAVIASICRQAVDPNCVSIQVGNIRPSRDFTYVTDTAAAFLAVSTLTVGTYNAGSGMDYDIGGICWKVAKKKSLVVQQERFRPPESEVDRLLCDASALKAATGWSPRSNIYSGLLETREWWRKRAPRRDLAYVA